MNDYTMWLIFIAFGVLTFTVFQLKESRFQKLKNEYRLLEKAHNAVQEERRIAEFSLNQLQRGLIQSNKLRSQLHNLRSDLRSAKMSSDFLSAKRLEQLEDYISESIMTDGCDFIFLGTFKPLAVYTFKEHLDRMLEGAQFEIQIISPWIKRETWDSIKVYMTKFLRKGGLLRIYIRDEESGLSSRLGDDIRDEVVAMGGEIVLIKQLHAKIYLVDRREAIVTSANLTRGGIEGNIEAGVWSNNPVLLKEICNFADALYMTSRS